MFIVIDNEWQDDVPDFDIDFDEGEPDTDSDDIAGSREPRPGDRARYADAYTFGDPNTIYHLEDGTMIAPPHFDEETDF